MSRFENETWWVPDYTRGDWRWRGEWIAGDIDGGASAEGPLAFQHANPEAARLRRARIFMQAVAVPERHFPSTEEYAVARAGQHYAYSQALLAQLGVKR